MTENQLDMLSEIVPATSGIELRREAMADHEEHKKAAIDWLRGELAYLYNRRVRRHTVNVDPGPPMWVSADDAREIYEASNFPPEYSANRSFFGAIFRGKAWQVVGRVQSRHPSNHARSICCYRYVG